MALASLKPKHLKRYRQILRLILRHGPRDLLRAGRLDQAFIDDELTRELPVKGDPQRLASELEQLGPTFVKLGQLLSTRGDLLPRPYLDALARLQDEVEPFPFAEVERTIEAEFGMPLADLYDEFEAEPVASASLGQVHRARLGNGRKVAVKVQRPGIRPGILDDLEALGAVAGMLDDHTDLGRRYAFRDMFEELRGTLLRELDYRREAHSLERMADSVEDVDELTVPRPVERLTGSRVLTMDYVEGTKITELGALRRTEIDGGRLAARLCEVYLRHILIEGFFHADPHPGNVLLTDDHRIALIDLGMVARLSLGFRRSLIKLLLAVADGDSGAATDLCVRLGTPLDDADEGEFQSRVDRLVNQFRDASLEELQLGRIVFELAHASARCGIRPPAELVTVGKALLHLDEVGRCLDPQFEPNAAIADQIQGLAARHLLHGVRPSRLLSGALEVNDFLQALPARVNRLLDALVERRLEFRVHAIDEVRLIDSLHRIGTRITLGLLLAALVVGASLIMSVETGYTIFGYPALAIVLFLIAVAGAIGLIVMIFVQDLRSGRH